MKKGVVANAISRLGEMMTARESSSILHMELYCENAACPAREIEIYLKDHDTTLIGMVRARGGMSCPVCSAQLKIHWIQDPYGYARSRERSARESVNCQMYVRDFCDPDLPVITGDVMGDDRLPPTPEGWFRTRRRNVQKRRFVRNGEE